MESSLKGKLPKKQQLRELIIHNIQDGTLAPGVRLLPVHNLAKQFQVSSSMVHRVLSELVSEELLESRGSLGFYVPEQKKATERKPAAVSSGRSDGKRRAYLSCGYHSDLVWKFDYETYAAVREKQLAFLEHMLEQYPEFHCISEQAEVLSVYFKAHPEKIDFYRKAHAEGRFTLTGNGSIPDLNLVSGETIVRIIQAGKQFYREVFGENVCIDNRNDSFGMCIQLPQILTQSGYRFVRAGRRPCLPEELEHIPFLWRGIDGSEIIVINPSHVVDDMGHTCNAPHIFTRNERLCHTLREVRKSNLPGNLYVEYTSEVSVHLEEIISLMAQVNREPGGVLLEFASLKNFCLSLDAEKLPVVTGEFNPIFTGCYTTRITVKQKFREAENRLFAAEMLAAGCAVSCDFREEWHRMLETSFHDSICGCHHDAANRAIMTRLDEVAGEATKTLTRCGENFSAFTVFNPGSREGRQIFEWDAPEFLPAGCVVQRDGSRMVGCAELPAYGIRLFSPAKRRKYTAATAVPAVFQTSFFDVDFSGVSPIIRDRYGVLSAERFGEILFRNEAGSMWCERFGQGYYGRDYQAEQLVSCEKGELFFRVETAGEVIRPPQTERHPFNDGTDPVFWHGFGSLRFRKIYRFYHELDYFSLKIILEWRGENTKIFLSFPLNLDVPQATGTYHVPFGSLVRAPYFEVDTASLSTLRELDARTYADARGDWPALHWVDYADLSAGCAIANNGTPGHQCVNGRILVSLLRSGTRILDGFMAPQPGALDNGTREYEFAIRPHDASSRMPGVYPGDVLNRKPVVFPGGGKPDGEPVRRFFRLEPENLVVSSFRGTRDGAILRIYEASGRASRTVLELPEGDFSLYESDLQELAWRPVSPELNFKPFEIKTLKIAK